jgi:hypothetical protein
MFQVVAGLLVAVLSAVGPGVLHKVHPAALRPDAVQASHTAPPSKDRSGDPVSYEADHVRDGNPATAWRVKGEARGEHLWLRFDRPVHVTRIGLIPGYAKIDPIDHTDRFFQDRIIRTVRYLFDGSITKNQSFEPRPELQSVKVDAITRSIRIDIVDTTAHGGRDYTAISEVLVKGQPA